MFSSLSGLYPLVALSNCLQILSVLFLLKTAGLGTHTHTDAHPDTSTHTGYLYVCIRVYTYIYIYDSQVVLVVKNPRANAKMQVWSLGLEDPLEKEIAAHSSILAWRISWTRLQSKRVMKSWMWLKWLSMHAYWTELNIWWLNNIFLYGCTINCLPISPWETCMQVKKQQFEPDMEQQTVSKLGKEYVQAVHCHPAYLTYAEYILRNAGWMN